MSGHLFVLDGPDACGKTTLAKRFIDNFTGTYIHMSYIKDDKEMFRMNYMSLFKAMVQLQKGENVVIDRGWISENIYSSVYRGGSGLAYDVRGLDRVIMKLCGVYVMCVPNPESATARHKRSFDMRSEMYDPDIRITQVAQDYWGFTHGLDFSEGKYPATDYVGTYINSDNGGFKHRRDVVSYDIDKDGAYLPRIIDAMLDVSFARQRHQVEWARERNNMVGHVADADVLFVGDKINPAKRGVWPFVDYGASSRVISKVLHDLDFYEPRGVWVNGCDADNTIGEIVAAMPRLKTVIALGNNAAASCGEAGIPHKCVYHPSYVGRFQKHTEFASQLKSLL